jgi:predicted RNA-binding protein with PIN domain
MPAQYFIDGYNVIHFSKVLQPLARESFENAREALVDKVARFCVATGNQAKIVFDGRGRKAEAATPAYKVKGLEIVYSPGHKTADSVIERFVYSATDRYSVIVVSGDQGIRQFCRGLGAVVMEPDNFLAGIRETDADTRNTINNLQRPDTQRRVEERLNESTLDRLRKLREQLDK